MEDSCTVVHFHWRAHKRHFNSLERNIEAMKGKLTTLRFDDSNSTKKFLHRIGWIRRFTIVTGLSRRKEFSLSSPSLSLDFTTYNFRARIFRTWFLRVAELNLPWPGFTIHVTFSNKYVRSRSLPFLSLSPPPLNFTSWKFKISGNRVTIMHSSCFLA